LRSLTPPTGRGLRSAPGHDVEKVMNHYSGRFLNSGVRKGETEQF